ncbi:hypothetical protein [Pontibacter chitinilyticus]|uniref:hypothetical protein n=1 Tax=Pontibacter chitinilyticus TaxID=2674989 RepID=UPI00321C1F31
MKASVRIALILLLSPVLFSSCNNCDTPVVTSLQPEDTAWLPYKQGDTIRYLNESNAAVFFICTEVAQGTIPADGYSPDEKCIDKQNTQADYIIKDIKDKYNALATLIVRKPESLEVKLAAEKNSSWEIDENNPKYPSLELNGTTYSQVFEVNLDSTKTGSLKRLLYSQTNGFIRAEYYDGRLLQLR